MKILYQAVKRGYNVPVLPVFQAHLMIWYGAYPDTSLKDEYSVTKLADEFMD